LHNYLELHPDIFLPSQKELYFWHINSNPNKAIVDILGNERVKSTLSTYLQCFDGAMPNQVVGEVCPSYLYYHQYVIESLKKYHPAWQDVKIIIILREPVSRLVSEYKFVCKEGLDPEHLSFEKALLCEPQRLKENKLILDLFYKSLSMYSTQVEPYLNAFNHVHVCLFDDLKKNPQQLMNDIYSFLGVSSKQLPVTELTKKYNSSFGARRAKWSGFMDFSKKIGVTSIFPESVRRSLKNSLFSQKIEISEEAISELRLEFKGDVDKLELLINKDLSCWK